LVKEELKSLHWLKLFLNLQIARNFDQIARNFDQPNRRVVIKTANEETGKDFDVTLNNVIFQLETKRDYPYYLPYLASVPVTCKQSYKVQLKFLFIRIEVLVYV